MHLHILVSNSCTSLSALKTSISDPGFCIKKKILIWHIILIIFFLFFFNFQKYKLSASTTPSPSEENKSFSNGFYHKNITGFEGEPSTTNGKGTPAFDNLAYASHDDDNVFKPKTDIYFDPSSLQRNQKGHLSRVESAREDNVPKKKGEKGCLILLFVLTVLGLLAGVAVIVYVQVFKGIVIPEVITLRICLEISFPKGQFPVVRMLKISIIVIKWQ